VPDLEAAELATRVAELEAQVQQNRDAFLQPLRSEAALLAAEVETARASLEETKGAVAMLSGVNELKGLAVLCGMLVPTGLIVSTGLVPALAAALCVTVVALAFRARGRKP
jgi:hypothetical protein